MIIRNNTMGLRAYNANRKTTNSIKKNLEKLSSGYRINRSADDAAGLAVSERLRAKVTELDRCQDNAAEGIDLARTADAALQEVNDMLKRARSLCIQAENGTYSDQELSAISDEMNHLFGEIDRISAGSYHNSICLFRQGVGHTYHEEYDEHFTVSDGLQEWGEVEFIVAKEFGEPEKATPATATFKLDNSINFDDVNTLEGKSIKIGKITYYFSKNPPSLSDYQKVNRVDIALTGTTEDALKKLTQSPSFSSSYPSDPSSVASVAVDRDARTVTLTAKLDDWVVDVNADGKTTPTLVPDGNGVDKNGIKVTSPNLQQVDGSGALNNQPVYGTTITKTITIKDNLVPDQSALDNLNRNYVSFSGTQIKLKDLKLHVGATRDEVGNALATAIKNASTNFDAVYSANGKLKLTVKNRPSNSATYYYVSEYTEPGTGGGWSYGTAWTSSSLGFNIQTQHSPEAPEECKITIPQSPAVPFSFSVGGAYYLYYDSTDSSTPMNMTVGAGETSYPPSYSSASSPTRIDTHGKSQAEIQADIASRIEAYVSNKGDVSISGNVITVKAKYAGAASMNLDANIKGTAITVTPRKYSNSTGGSTPALGITNISPPSMYFTQSVEIPFELGSTFDKANLVGKGFTVNGRSFEFVDGSGAGISAKHTDINISSCTDFNSLAAAIKSAVNYEVEIDANGKMKISYERTTSTTSGVTVIDGDDGITDGTPVEFEGGTYTGHSQTTIDFSDINEDNLDSLLGKGFRINCASCEGEYINVLFCWTNDGMPTEFKRMVEVGAGNFVERTIHNVPVELSKITSGDKIVENIVNQIEPKLDHYTTVAVGDPPTTLIAMEKRPGDVRDPQTNKLLRGSVESGVETNFTYSVDKKWVMDPLEGDLDKLQTSEVNIYVGSDPEPQLIPIHLPYIDLYHLRLAPPERVDLTDASQSASDWLDRVDRADLAISDARGTIGADFNCLEHAIQDLSNAHIQLSDAYSVIRDTDMAELMMKQVKDQILLQTQQSMLSQANQAPQGVLQLMQ